LKRHLGSHALLKASFVFVDIKTRVYIAQIGVKMVEMAGIGVEIAGIGVEMARIGVEMAGIGVEMAPNPTFWVVLTRGAPPWLYLALIRSTPWDHFSPSFIRSDTTTRQWRKPDPSRPCWSFEIACCAFFMALAPLIQYPEVGLKSR